MSRIFYPVGAQTLVWMVVGLGNPGQTYERSRHNIGFVVLDELAARKGLRFKRSWRAKAKVARTRLAGQDVVLVKPQTFMNRSGEAVRALMRVYGVASDHVVVVVDDVELVPGRLRVRKQGSAGNHNGLKSMIAAMGTNEFIRLRVGVGGPVPGGDLVEHVLDPVPAAEWNVLTESVGRVLDALACLVRRGVDQAMNEFNKRVEA